MPLQMSIWRKKCPSYHFKVTGRQIPIKFIETLWLADTSRVRFGLVTALLAGLGCTPFPRAPVGYVCHQSSTKVQQICYVIINQHWWEVAINCSKGSLQCQVASYRLVHWHDIIFFIISFNNKTLFYILGLCCQDILLPEIWRLITDLGPQCGLKAFLDILTATPNNTSHPLFSLLQLGCVCASHIMT